jgi:hypothetical protein
MSIFSVSDTTTNATTYLSTCGIEFIHPGVIHIEQLSFMSRQHVVAYRVGRLALVDSPPRQRNKNGAPLSLSRGGGGMLEIAVEYGTTLNLGYPPPIVASSTKLGGGPASPARNNNDGLVPVIV